jgi:hypothetical protein
MRKFAYVSLVALCMAGATGCFVSRKETTREVPTSSTTVERRSTVETVPQGEVIQKRTTTETTY